MVIYDMKQPIKKHQKSSIIKPIRFSDSELLAYEKGFEDGYGVAKRLYKPCAFWMLNENNESIKL